MQPTITMMQLIRNGKQPNGCEVLARFDYEHHGYEFKGCSLLLMGSGNIRIGLPRSLGKETQVLFTDRDVMTDLEDDAQARYLALGGDRAKVKYDYDLEGWPIMDAPKRSIYQVPLPPRIRDADEPDE